MSKVPYKIKKIVNQYLTALNDSAINVDRAILFGSYAKGNYNGNSDIDIAIISDSFEGNRIKDRSKIRAITLSTSSNLEVLPFSLQDFNKQDPFLKEIIKTVIVVSQ